MHPETQGTVVFGQERRQFKRFICREPVQFELKESGLLSATVSFDISRGGIRLNFYDFIPLHSELSLGIFISGHDMVECKARVMWVERLRHMDRYQAGLEFIDLEENLPARRILDQFVA